MIELIPFTPGIPHQRLECTLAGVTRLFEARWNARDDSWYLNVLELDETPIAMGLKIVLGIEIGRWSTHALFANRERAIIAVDLSGAQREAKLDDLGGRVVVAYVTELARQILQAPKPVRTT